MLLDRIYLDNAATSFPKPPAVMAAMVRYATELGASAGRGAYEEAVETGRLIAECRQLLNRLFNGEDPSHFIFTLNCSDALNIAIKGLIDPGEHSHVICTATDHNSILRPINAMAERGWVTQTLIAVDPATGLVDPADIRRAIRPNTRFIAITHGSNVTGALQPIRAIGEIARESDVPFIVDAAQSAGHVPINVQADGIDLLAAPGHKALMGPPGTGFLYLRPGMEKIVRPLREGGTGSISEHPVQPQFMPDKYECGSHNAIGIIGLAEGVRWVLQQGLANLRQHEMELMAHFIAAISEVGGVHVLPLVPTRKAEALSHRVAVFSIRIDGYSPSELAGRLESEFGLLTRPGLHCAPHIHAALGTAKTGGTTRLSFGAMTTIEQVDRAGAAINQLAAGRFAAQQ